MCFIQLDTNTTSPNTPKSIFGESSVTGKSLDVLKSKILFEYTFYVSLQ